MDRSAEAVQLYRDGCACSQAILIAYGQPLGLSGETAMRIAAGFAAGMRAGNTCGAVTGSIMVLGLRYAGENGDTIEGRAALNARVLAFTEEFRKRNGSLLCRELLGCNPGTPEGAKQAREQELFRTVCVRMIKDAAAILEQMETEE